MLTKILKLNYSFRLDSPLPCEFPCFKNPLTREPYICAAAINGEIYSFLNQKYSEGAQDGNEAIQRLFAPCMTDSSGIESEDLKHLVFLDAVFAEAPANTVRKNDFTEFQLDLSGDGKFTDAVPAGTVFQGAIDLMIFDGDDEEEMKKYLLDGLTLYVQNPVDILNGHGHISFVQEPVFQEIPF